MCGSVESSLVGRSLASLSRRGT